MRARLKLCSVAAMMGVFIICHSLIDLLVRNPTKKLRWFQRGVSITCRLGLRILNIEVEAEPLKSGKGQLIVCNHLSYVDVLVLSSRYPSLFITSVEIRETFLLGTLARLGGCFFIERRKSHRCPETVERELELVSEKLEEGFNIFLFPEGTSSNGESVLPFKTAFFQTAIDTKSSIQPLCLKYSSINGEAFSSQNADLVCWYGSMTFADHLYSLCQLKGVRALVRSLDLTSSEGTDRFTLGSLMHSQIKDVYERC